MNVSIAKARALVCACAELQSENGLIIGTAVEIYKNLVGADERMLADFAERAVAFLRVWSIVCVTRMSGKVFIGAQPKCAA